MGFEEDTVSVAEKQAKRSADAQVKEKHPFYFRAEVLFAEGVEVATDLFGVGGTEDGARERRVV